MARKAPPRTLSSTAILRLAGDRGQAMLKPDELVDLNGCLELQLADEEDKGSRHKRAALAAPRIRITDLAMPESVFALGGTSLHIPHAD